MAGAKKPVKSPRSGGSRTPEPDEEKIQIGIIRDVTNTGNGERGPGNGERGIGNGSLGTSVQR